MPWNQPGNSSNNKDPWTGRPKQTPPDLEAFLRDLLKKIIALFKLKSSYREATTLIKMILPPPLNAKVIGLIFSFLLLAWLCSGFFILDSSEQAVITRFGQYITTLSPGRHWILKPIESRYVIHPEKNATFSYQLNLLTRDENTVSIAATLHYSIVNARQYLFANTQALQSLQALTAKAIQQTLGQLPLQQLLTTPLSSLQQFLKIQINQSLEKYDTGLALNYIELHPIQLPEALKAAFADVTNAKADKQQLEIQAKTYAMQLEPAVKDQSERLIADAKAYQQAVILKAKAETTRFLALIPAYEASPALTRKRLYLEAMQVMMTHSNKMLIDNSENTSLYLSLNNSTFRAPEKTSEKRETNQRSSTALANPESPNTKQPPPIGEDTRPYDIAGGYE
jgi:membrane protease subunit HflK